MHTRTAPRFDAVRWPGEKSEGAVMRQPPSSHRHGNLIRCSAAIRRSGFSAALREGARTRSRVMRSMAVVSADDGVIGAVQRQADGRFLGTSGEAAARSAILSAMSATLMAIARDDKQHFNVPRMCHPCATENPTPRVNR
jgi:hypothetical protein